MTKNIASMIKTSKEKVSSHRNRKLRRSIFPIWWISTKTLQFTPSLPNQLKAEEGEFVYKILHESELTNQHLLNFLIALWGLGDLRHLYLCDVINCLFIYVYYTFPFLFTRRLLQRRYCFGKYPKSIGNRKKEQIDHFSRTFLETKLKTLNKITERNYYYFIL